MSLRDAPLEDSMNRDRRSEVTTHLHGHRLVIVRLVSLSLYVLSVGLFVASIPPNFAILHLLCTGTATACNATGQLAPGDVRRLQELGLSIDFFATYTIVITLIFSLGYWLVAALLFWRKSDNPLALLAAVTLGTFPLAFNSSYISILPSPWSLLGHFISFLGDLSIILFFYVFPSGHFVPRWTRWLLIPAIAYWGFNEFFPRAPFNPFLRFSALNTVTFLVVVGSIVVIQVYRYRRVSTPTQRQQTKWVVFGVSIGVGGFLVLNSLFGFFPSLFPVGSLASLTTTTVVYGLMLLIPLSIGFAVLRSRLWDIDLIINRTLVYGTLTATLALLYVGLVIVLQFLLRGLISQTSDIAIVASTLVIYVLFQPLRHRIQQVIDRRFYRRKYDAARTLAAFSATLRNEVDLERLREALVAVVEQTMQPSHVSLWLRPAQQDRQPQTTWISSPLIENISAQDGED